MRKRSITNLAILLTIGVVCGGLIAFQYYYWTFFLLTTGGIFMLTRRKPKEEVALLLMMLFLPWMNERGYGPIEIGFTVYPSYMFAALAGGILIVKKIRRKDTLRVRTPLDLLLISFLAILGISIIQTRFIPAGVDVVQTSTVSIFNRIPYLRGMAGFCSILFMVFIFYAIINICCDRKIWKQMLITLFISATIVSIYGLFGFFTYSSGITKPLLYLTKLFGWSPIGGNWPIYVRIQGLFCEPLIFGAYLVTILPLEIVLLLKKTPWIQRKWLIVMIIPQVLALAFTFSRSAWLGILAAMSVILLYYFTRFIVTYRHKVIIPLLIVVVLAGVVLKHQPLKGELLNLKERFSVLFNIDYYPTLKDKCSDLKERFSTLFNIGPYLIAHWEKKDWATPEQWSAFCRVNDIIAGWRMFLAHPFLGVGWGNYIFHYSRYDPRLAEWDWLDERPVSVTVNNLPIKVLSETGSVGFMIFVGIIGTFIFTIAKVIRRQASEWRAPLVGYLAAFIGLMVCYQFFSTFYFSFVWVMLGMGMAARRLALRECNQESKDGKVKISEKA